MRLLTAAPYPNASLGQRRVLRALSAALVAVLALSLATGARAASTFFIRGGGSGHGIGMSQYGAYGYALHGATYQAILAHYYSGTALGQTAPATTVRVLLTDGQASFTGAASASGSTGTAQSLKAATTYSVTAKGNQLVIADASGKAVGAPFPAPLTVVGLAPLQVPGLGGYRGALQFRPDGHGGVMTVNLVAIDDYVRGVISEEMPSSWPAAALEAQAVAARTYALTTGVSAGGYDLYSDTRSQMYGGTKAETAATDAAVAATSGQVVTYGGKPVVTYFFASSGGYTESIQNVWIGSTPEPWLTGVPDPYDSAGNDPYHVWGQQLSLVAAAAKLGGLVHGRLVGIAVTGHGASPRILSASVVGTAGTTTVTGPQLQSIFGLPTTYAAFTTVTVTGARGALRGSVFPASAAASVSVQSLGSAGVWQSISRLPVSVAAASGRSTSSGAFRAGHLVAGRYRIVVGGLTGPTVTVR